MKKVHYVIMLQCNWGQMDSYLVLCGDLSLFQHYIEQQITNMKIYSTGTETNHEDSIDIESFSQ